MDLREIQQNINKLENQLVLTFDNPSSVRLQVRQINLIQKQLKAIKKKLIWKSKNLIKKPLNPCQISYNASKFTDKERQEARGNS